MLQQKFGTSVNINQSNIGTSKQLLSTKAATGAKKGTANVAPSGNLSSTSKPQSFREGGTGGHVKQSPTIDPNARKTVNVHQNVNVPKTANGLHGASGRQNFGPKNIGAAQNVNVNQKGKRGQP